MGNIFNTDFRDFIEILNKHEVKYVLVGAYAVILHGYRRTTGDMDVWIKNDEENYKCLVKVFYEFGLPLIDLTKENFLDNSNILTALKGCDFDEAYNLSQIFIEDDLPIRFININTLRTSKKAVGRFKDLDDLEKLKDL
jgi:hypothetical protein